jgi:translation initiation factor IF-1
MLMEQKKEHGQTATGIVTEALPNTLFRVKLDSTGDELLAYLAGKMRMNRIRVLIGDKVVLELDSYGGKARITKRL